MAAALIMPMIIVGLVFVILCVNLGISALLAQVGGWRALSRIYQDPNPSWKPQFVRQYISVGTVGYNRALNALVGPDGLHLKMSFTLRFRHLPLLIPWSEIASITAKKMLFGSLYDVVLRQPGTKLGFNGALGEAILKEWQEHSPALT